MKNLVEGKYEYDFGFTDMESEVRAYKMIVDVARNMKYKYGCNCSMISEVTGLYEEEIQAL